MIKEYTIENPYQKLTLLNYGATIHKWQCFKDFRNIVISNHHLSDYLNPKNGYFGSTIGRVANRIKEGRFSIEDNTYQLERNFPGQHHGHGGSLGFFNQPFEVIDQGASHIRFRMVSYHLDQGYPGDVILHVTYVLKDKTLEVTYDAISSMDTILNITNHAHFNLSDEPTILNHTLQADFQSVLEVDKHLVPTGKIIDVQGTLLDFARPKRLEEVIMDQGVRTYALGLDHAFLFNKNSKQVALTYKDKSLVMSTSYPGVQVYSMNYEIMQPLLNRSFFYHMGIALEPQYEPDAVNHSNFSDVILKKGEPYQHFIRYQIIEG